MDGRNIEIFIVLIGYIFVIRLILRSLLFKKDRLLLAIKKLFGLTQIKELNRLQLQLDLILVKLDQGVASGLELPIDSRLGIFWEMTKLLLNNLRKFGGSVKRPLKMLRSQIGDELEFEGLIKEDYLKGLFQFLTITAFTWIFIYFMGMTLEKTIPTKSLILIAMFQIAGFILHHFTFKFQRESTFLRINVVIRQLMLSSTLGSAGFSLNTVLENFEAYQKRFFKCESRVLMIYNRLEAAITNWGVTGSSPIDVFNELLNEALGLKKLTFKTFTTRVNRYRFLILAVFFLGSYFWQLFSFISLFLIE